MYIRNIQHKFWRAFKIDVEFFLITWHDFVVFFERSKYGNIWHKCGSQQFICHLEWLICWLVWKPQRTSLNYLSVSITLALTNYPKEFLIIIIGFYWISTNFHFSFFFAGIAIFFLLNYSLFPLNLRPKLNNFE